MSEPTKYARLAELARALDKAQRASIAACDRRAQLPVGSSRARVTTANARWASAAEHRDRLRELVRAEVHRVGLAHSDAAGDLLQRIDERNEP